MLFVLFCFVFFHYNGFYEKNKGCVDSSPAFMELQEIHVPPSSLLLTPQAFEAFVPSILLGKQNTHDKSYTWKNLCAPMSEANRSCSKGFIA